MREPHVFLLDEPLSNLDAKLRRAMRIELRALHQRLGVTMVHVTHDQEEAMTLGDKLAVMDSGIIRQFDTPANIYDYPADRFVASFVGVPEMNFIEGELKGNQFVSPDITLDIPTERVPKSNDKIVVLGIRPEDVTVSTGNSARVMSYERHGDHTDLFVTLGATKLSARKHGTHEEVDTVNIDINTSNVHFFVQGAKGKRLQTQ